MSFFIENLFSNNPQQRIFFIAVVITVVISICLHELGHGWMAIRLGDDTPIHTGHMTLNPLVHMGIFSLLMLVTTGISWGQMPVDPTRLRGKYAEAMVAFAGPAVNVLIILVTFPMLIILLKTNSAVTIFGDQPKDRLAYLLYIFIRLNFVLTLLNLLPIPPLDGSRILSNIWRLYHNMLSDPAKLGFMNILLIVVFIRAGDYLYPWADHFIIKVLSYFNL